MNKKLEISQTDFKHKTKANTDILKSDNWFRRNNIIDDIALNI